jgi:hypothetical protein
MSRPSKKLAKSYADVAALRMHVARATMVTPRSSLLRKSVRVDSGDVGPPSNIKHSENCATQDSSERSLASLADAHSRHPEGVYAKCGVLQTHTGEVCGDHLGTLYSVCSRKAPEDRVHRSD